MGTFSPYNVFENAMAAYRIYRMKEQASQQFRWAPHVSGATQVKRKDYDEGPVAEAANEYAAWQALRDARSGRRAADLQVRGIRRRAVDRSRSEDRP
jgi:hypothetical protein